MRIAFFTDSYHPVVSGVVSSLDGIAKGMVERGHEVRIICPEFPPDRMQDVSDDEKILRVPSGTAIVTPDRIGFPWRTAETWKLVEEFQPDIVHMQTEFTLGAMGRNYCRYSGLPVLSTCHTYYEMYMGSYLPFLPRTPAKALCRSWIKATYFNDDFIIVPSKHIREVLQGYGLKKEYRVIPSGVDERMFKPEPEAGLAFRRSLAAERPGFGEGPLLMYAGRIGLEKNLDMLASAMRTVFAARPDTRLLMVGGGPARDEVESIFQKMGLNDRVAWFGFMKRSQLPAIYSACDLFVFPSTTETQGMVTIEAMLCGLPVVGVARMGTAEIMAGDEGGLLSPDDPEVFAEKVLTLIEDGELRSQKASEARSHGMKWSLGACLDKLEGFYGHVRDSRKD